MTDRDPAELTLRAIVFGLALGIPLAAANVYAGLKLGFVDAGTTTIVLVAFALFGAGARRFTAQEANAAQVAGSSAGAMTITAGVVGPIPALALSGHEVSPIAITAWAIAIAVFGTLLAIPFREHLIAVQRLAFPTARAAGELIRGLFVERSQTRSGVGLLAGAALAAAAVVVARDELGLIPGAWMFPFAIAGVPAAQLSLGIAAGPLLAGVGLLVGARTGLSMLLGALVAWVAIAPMLVERGVATPSYASLVSWLLWPGAALMVAGSLTSLALSGRQLLRAFTRSAAATAGTAGTATSGAAGRWLRLTAAAAALATIALGWRIFGVHPVFALLGIALAAVFAIAAMHATGETDNTPAGPLGGLTQIVVGAIGPGGVDAPLQAGGIVNGATAHAATMMNAWKTADVIGRCSPHRLIVAQLAGITTGALSAALAYWLVREAYGLGTPEMPAAAALSWKATADAVAHGTSSMPAGAPLAALIGAIAGVALTLIERLAPRLRRFTPSPIAVGTAFILPASVVITLALTAVVYSVIAAKAPAFHTKRSAALASGLIVGEAFAGVVLAAIVVLRA